MAGLGRKVFTAGEVLTSADVNGYLMDQTVMVFADATARSSAISTPSAGMMSYRADGTVVEVYNGTAWAGVDTTISSINGTAVVNTLTVSTATAYTLQPTDQGTYIQFTAAAGTVTIGTATAFTAGQTVQIFADGTATVIAGDGAVTLSGAGTAGTAVSFTAGQYEAIGVVGLGSNAYRIIGATVVA